MPPEPIRFITLRKFLRDIEAEATNNDQMDRYLLSIKMENNNLRIVVANEEQENKIRAGQI